jgi:hypothetical protein
MSGITRSDVFGRSLKIHNHSNNVLEMDSLGNLFINTKSINSNVTESISLSSIQNIDLKTTSGNITTNSTNGSLILRNGTYTDSSSLTYTYNNITVGESNDSTSPDYYNYFTSNLIIKPYTNKEEVVALRNNSLLIESLGGKPITLYSNDGINNVAHGNITSISDNDFIVQTNNKINLTSLGFISMNSERLVSSVEEDISLFSSTGTIILGGNGITNNGLVVNSNTNNNFTGFGKTGTAQRSIDVEINHSSVDNINKNGIKITNNTGSNNNSVPINPEIELGNSTTNIKLDLGVGPDLQDANLKVICKKVDIDSKTYLLSLNNFSFTLNDVGKLVTWNDTTYTASTILKIINDTTSRTGYANGYGIIANINTETTSQINSFGYQIGYINRNNFGYLKTKTGSDLSLGTNNKHILNITNNGNVGINTNTPDGSCQIKNTYGTLFNNNIVSSNIYSNGKAIQLTNGNIVLISNSKPKTGSTYSLMGFIYNDTDVVIQSFTIVSGSNVEIQFGVDNLVSDSDLFAVCYSYKKNNSSSVPVYFTESNVYKNDGTVFNSTLKNTIEHDSDLNQSSYPNVKSFKFTKSGLDIAGYAIVYNDLIVLTNSDKVNTYVQVFSNTSPGNILTAGKFDVSEDLYPVGGNSKLNNDIVVNNIDSRINKYIGVEINTDTNSILIINYSRVEDNTSNIYHQTYLHRFILSLTTTVYSLARKNFNSDTDFTVPIKIEGLHTGDDLATYKTYMIEGANIKLVQTDTSTSPDQKTYIVSFYKKDLSSVRKEIYTKKIILNADYGINAGTSVIAETLSDSSANSLIVDVPFVSKKNEGIYVVVWVNVNTIKYLERNLLAAPLPTKTITSTGAQQIFILCLNDTTGVYKETIVSWNNNDTNDTINYQSVSLKKILSSFNIFSVKNNNIDFKLTNEGVVTLTNSDKINLNHSLEIDKANSKVNILAGKDLTISSNSAAGSGAGVDGQFNYYGTNLYIYLGGAWKQVTLT